MLLSDIINNFFHMGNDKVINKIDRNSNISQSVVCRRFYDALREIAAAEFEVPY